MRSPRRVGSSPSSDAVASGVPMLTAFFVGVDAACVDAGVLPAVATLLGVGVTATTSFLPPQEKAGSKATRRPANRRLTKRDILFGFYHRAHIGTDAGCRVNRPCRRDCPEARNRVALALSCVPSLSPITLASSVVSSRSPSTDLSQPTSPLIAYHPFLIRTIIHIFSLYLIHHPISPITPHLLCTTTRLAHHLISPSYHPLSSPPQPTLAPLVCALPDAQGRACRGGAWRRRRPLSLPPTGRTPRCTG